MTQRLFCYVDETGQDTRGELYIVAVVVTDDRKAELEKLLAEIETASRKHRPPVSFLLTESNVPDN